MRKSSYEKVFKATLATTVAAGAFVATAPIHTKAEAPTFKDVKDIPSHHFYEAVMEYTSKGMISGYKDGTFKPGQNITRQDAAKLLALVLDLDTKDVKNPGFKDVSKTHPYYGYIAALVEAGIISGYEDNTFKPQESLTRAQMAKIIVLGFELEEAKTDFLPFNDINEKQWHIEFVRTLYANDITTGTTPTTFSPNALVTRGQMASFVFRSEAIAIPKVDEDQVAVDAAVAQLKAGAVTVSGGHLASAENKLAAVQKYVTSLITEKGVSATVVEGKTAGDYIVTLTKGEAKVEKTIAMTFDFGADDRFVTEINAVNAKQIEVKFATPVSKTTVLDSSNTVRNMTFTMVTGATVNPGPLKGSLSEDGKTLTITANWIFDGEYAFKSTDAIQSATGVKFEEHTAIVKANDKVAPKLVSGSATAKTSTNAFALFFDEPVSAAGVIAYVNDGAATVANDPTNPNRLNVTASKQVAADTAATIKLINVKDYNNNNSSPNPLETTIKISEDTVVPTVKNVKVVGENRLELTYDKEMNIASFTGKARLVYSNGTITNLTATAGENAKTVILTGNGVVYNDSSNAILFVDADVKDTVGNNAALYSTNVTLNKDKTAPAFTTVEFKDGKIVANFTEDIAAGRNRTINVINQATGVATPIHLNYASGQNAVIQNNTLTINHPLANGNYLLRLPADTVVDKASYPNSNSIATHTFTVEHVASTDFTRPVVVAVTNTPVASGRAPGVEQTATYTAIDADSGINLKTVQDINNYTWDGKALPIGSYVTTVITGSEDRATSVAVTVHVPSDRIQTTKTATLTVNNIRDNAGNTIASVATGDVTFVSGTELALDYAAIGSNGTSLVLGFTEAIKSLDAYDFQITVNGHILQPDSITSIVRSNREDNTFVATIKASVADDVQIDGKIKDVIYLDTSRYVGYNSGDLILEVLDSSTYSRDASNTIDINLHARTVTDLKVRLIQDSLSPVQDLQGNYAIFNRDIVVK